MSRPFPPTTPGYNLDNDSGDDLFEHDTVATIPWNPTQQTFMTQPTQPISTPTYNTARDPISPSIQVAASSPLMRTPSRGPSIAPLDRGALNGGMLAQSMAPPGTQFRQPQPAFRQNSQQPRDSQNTQTSAIVLSDDEARTADSSDDDIPRNDIKPSVFTQGGRPSNAGRIEESPFKNMTERFKYDSSSPQNKRTADAMADAYSNPRRSKVARQTGPARAQPVEPQQDDILLRNVDYETSEKARRLRIVFPDASVNLCLQALHASRGNDNEAMEWIATYEEAKNGAQEKPREPELTPAKPQSLANYAKQQAQQPARKIADKWSQARKLSEVEVKRVPEMARRSIQEKYPPKDVHDLTQDEVPKPRRRLVQGRRTRSSSPVEAPSPAIHEVIDINDDNDSAIVPSEEELDDDKSFLNLLNTCTKAELLDVSSQTEEVVDLVISRRPFQTLDAIRSITLDSSSTTRAGKERVVKKQIGDRLVESALEMWSGYIAVDQLVARCEELGKPIASEMKAWGFNAFGTAHAGELELVDLKDSAHDSGIGTPTSSASADEADGKPKALIKRNKLLKQPVMMSEKLVMKDYQVAGLNWLALLFKHNLSCILADDMGLGKTCQVIAFFAHLHEIGVPGPHLVVVPGSTLENWLREFENFCPKLRVDPYYAGIKERPEMQYNLKNQMKNINVIVTTYDMASKPDDAAFIRKIVNPVVCVYDEGHALKNSQSKRYKQLMKIPAQFRLLLTGTPLQNNLQELIALLAFIMPDIFVNQQEDLLAIFKHKAKTTDKDHGALLSAQRITRARSMMTPFILRRKKHQVLKDLPAKTSRVEYCELASNQRSIYDKIAAEAREIFLRNRKEDGTRKTKPRGAPTNDKVGTSILMELRKAAIHPLLFRRRYTDDILHKMANIFCKKNAGRENNLVYEDLEAMTDFELHRFCLDDERNQCGTSMHKFALQNDPWMDSSKINTLVNTLRTYIKEGHRTLIFSQFTMVMDILEVVFKTTEIPFYRLDGSTKMEERQDLIDSFYADDTPVFMLSTKAGGAGINLACADRVIVFDSSFNPQDDVQAENRAHRVGQTRPVEVVKLVTKGTIEEQILALGQSKLVLDERVAGEDTVEQEKKGQEMVQQMMLQTLDSSKTEKGKSEDLSKSYLQELKAAGLDVSMT